MSVSADACVSVADVLLAVLVLSSAKRALALDELAPVTDIYCSWKALTRIDTIFLACLNDKLGRLRNRSVIARIGGSDAAPGRGWSGDLERSCGVAN